MKLEPTLGHNRRAMKRSTFALTAACAFLFGLTTPALAQRSSPTTAPTFEVGAAYQALFVTDDPGTTFPAGFALDVAINSGAFGFVVEGGFSRRSESHASDDIQFDFWHAGAGVRWSRRMNPRFSPYVQILAGVAFHDVKGGIAGFDQSDITSHFMWQPGGGVNVALNTRVGIFGAVDYRQVFLDEDTEGDSGLNEIRLLAGVRLVF